MYYLFKMNDIEQFILDVLKEWNEHPDLGPKELEEEDMAFKLYGRSRTLSLAGSGCVKCGEFNLEFRDGASQREYQISALCQCCQDMFFGGEEE